MTDTLAQHGSIRRGFLGISSQPVQIPEAQQDGQAQAGPAGRQRRPQRGTDAPQDGGSGCAGAVGGGEHVFAKLRGPSDGMLPLQRNLQPAGTPQTAEPSEPHTSIFVRTRAMTSVVNSVVPALPPRSWVRTPRAVDSRTDS